MHTPQSWADRSQLEALYSDYGIRFVADFGDGIELWKTGWNEPAILTREDGVHPKSALYELEFVKRRFDDLIQKTKPTGWKKP